MIRGLRSSHLSKRQVALVLRYSTTSAPVAEETNVDQQASQRELRERAVAEAVAREEALAAKAKQLLDLRYKSQELISQLNQTPSTLISSRLQKLQDDLSKIDESKVKQLDEELEQFMFEQMKLPASETINRPWLQENSSGSGSATEGGKVGNIALKSTASNSYLNEFPNLRPSADHHPYTTQELYLRHLNHSRRSGNLGSQMSNVYFPRDEVRKPKSVTDISVSNLLAAGCHLGHAKSMWRPTTQPFIYGEYDGIHIIDLNETIVALNRAVKVIQGVASKGGIVLYVGTNQNWEQHRALEEAANRSHGYYVSKRWIPGTITNFTEVTKQTSGTNRIELDMSDTPTQRNLPSDTMDNLMKPDLVVLMNPVDNRNCINECIKLRIPTIGLCDTDMEPSLLTYPIPSNDDSTRVSSMMLGIFSKAAEEGVKERRAMVEAYKKSQR